jgi:hypothetical protein
MPQERLHESQAADPLLQEFGPRSIKPHAAAEAATQPPTNGVTHTGNLRRRATFWAWMVFAAALVAGIFNMPTDVAKGANTTTITAIEDVQIDNGQPYSNFGNTTYMTADTSPTVKRLLVRFPLNQLPPRIKVTSAKLRMYVTDPSQDAGTVHRVWGNWSEGSTVWANKPTTGPYVAKMSAPANTGTWREAEVRYALAQGSTASFLVISNSTDGVVYSTRETGRHSSSSGSQSTLGHHRRRLRSRQQRQPSHRHRRLRQRPRRLHRPHPPPRR